MSALQRHYIDDAIEYRAVELFTLESEQVDHRVAKLVFFACSEKRFQSLCVAVAIASV